MLTRIRDDERGVALVVAVTVVFVVMLLATVVYTQAVHNSTASSYDRKRLQSVDAAEASLNYFFNYLEQTPSCAPQPNGSCSPASLSARCSTITNRICASNPLAAPQPISIRPWPADDNLRFCPSPIGSGSYGNITVGNNTNLSSTLSVGPYTPCTAVMNNQNAFHGQVVGGNVSIGNDWSMNYRPIVIPGALVTGFSEDISYLREIA